MDKGWGLTLASDPITANFFSNTNTNTNSNAPVTSFFKVKRSSDLVEMNGHPPSATNSRTMFQFPVSLGVSTGKEEESAAPAEVVDFFKDKRSEIVDDHGNKDSNKTTSHVIVKKENSVGDQVAPLRSSLGVNVS